MSPEPSSSPGQPGASPGRPVWTADASGPGRAGQVLDLAVKVITLAYILMGTWQMAKHLNPPLQVRQDMAVRALKRRLARPPARALPAAPHEAVRSIYDGTR